MILVIILNYDVCDLFFYQALDIMDFQEVVQMTNFLGPRLVIWDEWFSNIVKEWLVINFVRFCFRNQKVMILWRQSIRKCGAFKNCHSWFEASCLEFHSVISNIICSVSLVVHWSNCLLHAILASCLPMLVLHWNFYQILHCLSLYNFLKTSA